MPEPPTLVSPNPKQPWRWLLINLLVLPGLGTIKGGDLRSGWCQLILGLVGFLITAVAVARIALDWVDAWQTERPVALDNSLIWWTAVGVLLFFVSWFWALASSVRLLRKIHESGTEAKS